MIAEICNVRDFASLARLDGRAAATGDDIDQRPVRALLTTSAAEPPLETLEVARELVRLLRAELHILRLGQPDDESLPPHTRDAARIPADRPCHWGSDARPIRTLETSTGSDGTECDPTPYIAEYARDLGASLVIVSNREHSGQRVVALAGATMRPVLVARRRVATGSVLAATGLSHERTPVVRSAAALGRLLHATVAAIHNVSPRWVELTRNHALVRRLHPDREATSCKLQALVDATYSLHVSTAVLTSELDTTRAILREAKRREAATIVVGTNVTANAPRRDTLGAEIVNLADTSVLVIPVESSLPPSVCTDL